jgi:hypothetical protein
LKNTPPQISGRFLMTGLPQRLLLSM